MSAVLLIDDRLVLTETEFAELVIWQAPEPVLGSSHNYKYRLAFVSNDICVVRFDNEAGKGDHLHVGGQQQPYAFTDLRSLQDDFWNAVTEWRKQR